MAKAWINNHVNCLRLMCWCSTWKTIVHPQSFQHTNLKHKHCLRILEWTAKTLFYDKQHNLLKRTKCVWCRASFFSHSNIKVIGFSWGALSVASSRHSHEGKSTYVRNRHYVLRRSTRRKWISGEDRNHRLCYFSTHLQAKSLKAERSRTRCGELRFRDGPKGKCKGFIWKKCGGHLPFGIKARKLTLSHYWVFWLCRVNSSVWM